MSAGSYYRSSKKSLCRVQMSQKIIETSQSNPRYGYRRITALLRREGEQINAKRVQRIRRLQGLQVRKKQRRSRRVVLNEPQRLRASRPNEVWSWDLVHDQTENGSAFRRLTLIDEYTKELLAIHVDRSIRAVDAITVIEAAIETCGRPQHIRSDNGPQFIAFAIQDWMKDNQIQSLYIRPGEPWEQAWIESFRDKLRDECLNREIFGSLLEAQIVIGAWRVEYNQRRPHSSLGYQTPAEFARNERILKVRPEGRYTWGLCPKSPVRGNS
jgi:putative transposase